MSVAEQLDFSSIEWLSELHEQQRITDSRTKLLRALVKRGLSLEALPCAAALIVTLEESATGADR